MKLNMIVNGTALVTYNFGEMTREDLATVRIYLEKAYKFGFSAGLKFGTGLMAALPVVTQAMNPVIAGLKDDVTGIKKFINESVKLLPAMEPTVHVNNDAITGDGEFAVTGKAVAESFAAVEVAVKEAMSSQEMLEDVTTRLIGMCIDQFSIELELNDEEHDVVSLSWWKRMMVKHKTGIDIAYETAFYPSEDETDKPVHLYVVELPVFVPNLYLSLISILPSMAEVYKIIAAYDRSVTAFMKKDDSFDFIGKVKTDFKKKLLNMLNA